MSKLLVVRKKGSGPLSFLVCPTKDVTFSFLEKMVSLTYYIFFLYLTHKTKPPKILYCSTSVTFFMGRREYFIWSVTILYMGCNDMRAICFTVFFPSIMVGSLFLCQITSCSLFNSPLSLDHFHFTAV